MDKRSSAYPIDQVFTARRSHYAMSGESISDKELMTLFEAARWAPSSYNNQPWRFIYAKRDSSSWEKLFNLLVKFNQSWACNAAVLVVVISAKYFSVNNKPSRTHSFDTGAAWENFALQATMLGLIAHGMEGFDYTQARATLNIPHKYSIEAMIAVGRPGDIADLPIDLQERDKKPSHRLSLDKLIFEGTFTSTS